MCRIPIIPTSDNGFPSHRGPVKIWQRRWHQLRNMHINWTSLAQKIRSLQSQLPAARDKRKVVDSTHNGPSLTRWPLTGLRCWRQQTPLQPGMCIVQSQTSRAIYWISKQAQLSMYSMNVSITSLENDSIRTGRQKGPPALLVGTSSVPERQRGWTTK